MKPVFKQHISSLSLYPFSSLNDLIDLRIGILTIKEKWLHGIKLFPEMKIDIDIPDNLLPDINLFIRLKSDALSSIIKKETLCFLQHPWQLFLNNSDAIQSDFQLLTKGRSSANVSDSITCIKPEDIFIENDAEVNALLLDAENGPIYIGQNSRIMAGSILKGPISIGKGASVKFGTYIYGGTSVGPYCVVGGEIKNSNIMDYSNKAHHGYIGDSVIGKWCNLGAGTSVSNMKNNASPISIIHPKTHIKFEVGQKCGILMGDFSKSSINSSFNSGTIVGNCSNIFHSGVLLPKYIPDFSWGDSNKERYKIENLITDIQKWMSLKNLKPSQELIQKINKEYYK